MSRIEDRLADALDAAARAVPQGTLRPLVAPEPGPGRLSPRRPVWLSGVAGWLSGVAGWLSGVAGWLAPAAAAAGVALVVWLAVVVGQMIGPGHLGRPLGGVNSVPRYYVEVGIPGGRPVVRSRATGAVTASVPVPPGDGDIVSPAQDGAFFAVAPASRAGAATPRLYRFRLTGAGRITGFAPVPGGMLAGADWTADAIATSPDASQVAVAFRFTGPGTACGARGERACARLGTHPDYIAVIDTATGAKNVWRGGTGPAFSVASLSWAHGGRRLVFLGQTCGGFQLNSEVCGNGRRTAEVRALDPARAGGRLDSGPVLLRQSALFPDIVQAYISPDGTVITALVLRGPVLGNAQIGGLVPASLSVEQIAVRTGKPLAVLYRKRLGRTPEMNVGPDPLALVPDAAGQHWLLDVGLSNGRHAGVNGWLHDGRLLPLPPANGRATGAAW